MTIIGKVRSENHKNEKYYLRDPNQGQSIKVI